MKRVLAGLLSITLIFSGISANALELSTNGTMEVNENVDDVNVSEDAIISEGTIIDDNSALGEEQNNIDDESDSNSIENEESATNESMIATYDTKTVDHTHIWASKYDTTNHWEYCTICGEKRNVTTHTYTDHWFLGYEGCNGENYSLRTCECGYSYTYKKPHTPGDTWYTDVARGVHNKSCKVCGYWTAHGNCVDSNGKLLTCLNPGTCAICGVYRGSQYHFLNNGRCRDCRKVFFTYTQPQITYNSDYSQATVTWSITPIDSSAYVKGNYGDYSTNANYKTRSLSTERLSDGTVKFTQVITFNPDRKTKMTTMFGNSQLVTINGVSTWSDFPAISWTIWQDHVAPIQNEVIQKDQASANGWATIKQLTISGTENLSDIVYITISDKETGEKYVTNASTNVVDNKFSYVCTPAIEGDTSGRTYVVTVTDRIGNVSTKEFTVAKTDGSAPALSEDSTLKYTNWTNTAKNVDLNFYDFGSSNIQLSYNSQSSYAALAKSGEYYNWKKTYSAEQTGTTDYILYVKDALGNATSYTLTVGNIDYTKPIVNSISSTLGDNKATVTIKATDSASGVKTYYLKDASGNIQNNTTGIFTVNKIGSYTGYVMDVAGNTSDSKNVDVKINYTLTVNPNGGIWSNSTNSQTFSLTNGTGKTISNPTRNGYTFKGWTLSGTGSSFKDSTFTMGTTNASLTANWSPTNYTITYNLNGGSATNPNTYNIESTTFTLNNPTKTGYTFAGWTGSNGTTKQTSVSIAKGSTGNKTYTANWNPINYTITYNLDGGSASNPNTYNIESATFTLNNPTKTGYTFVGWTGSNGTTKQTSVSIAKGSTGNKTYAANYTINQYDVTYIDVIDSTSGTQLGKTTKKVNYNSNVRGSDLGNSTSDNAYHNGYYYVSDTSAIVSTNGATVYRIFKLRTVDKTSNLTWNDNNNKNGFRPSKYTLKLLRNGSVFKQIDLPSSQTSYTFNNLNKYDSNGKAYTYTFRVDANSDRYKMSIDGNGNITENYQNSTFSVIIPKNISLNGNTGKGSYNIKVDGTFYYNDTLTVIPSNSFKMIDKSGISNINASVSQDTTTFTKSNLASTKGTISLSKAEFAGSYTGTFNFAIKFTMKN